MVEVNDGAEIQTGSRLNSAQLYLGNYLSIDEQLCQGKTLVTVHRVQGTVVRVQDEIRSFRCMQNGSTIERQFHGERVSSTAFPKKFQE